MDLSPILKPKKRKTREFYESTPIKQRKAKRQRVKEPKAKTPMATKIQRKLHNGDAGSNECSKRRLILRPNANCEKFGLFDLGKKSFMVTKDKARLSGDLAGLLEGPDPNSFDFCEEDKENIPPTLLRKKEKFKDKLYRKVTEPFRSQCQGYEKVGSQPKLSSSSSAVLGILEKSVDASRHPILQNDLGHLMQQNSRKEESLDELERLTSYGFIRHSDPGERPRHVRELFGASTHFPRKHPDAPDDDCFNMYSELQESHVDLPVLQRILTDNDDSARPIFHFSM